MQIISVLTFIEQHGDGLYCGWNYFEFDDSVTHKHLVASGYSFAEVANALNSDIVCWRKQPDMLHRLAEECLAAQARARDSVARERSLVYVSADSFSGGRATWFARQFKSLFRDHSCNWFARQFPSFFLKEG